MRAVLYHGGSRLTVGELESPHAGPGEVRVRVDSVGLCRSDLYGYSGRNNRRDEVLGPGETLVMGHEAVGVIDEVGAGVEGLAVGESIAIDPIEGCGECERCAVGDTNLCPDRRVYGCIPAAPGGFAEAMVAPAANATPLSGARPLEWGSLVEPLTVGEHGVRLAGVEAGDPVLVVGGGVIGLGAAFAAARRGAAVTVSEPQPERRAVIERLGLTAVPPEELEALPPDFACALDCVARAETVAAAVRAVGRSGTVVLVGIFSDQVPFPVSRMVENETRIIGSFAYAHEDFVNVAAWVGSTDLDLGSLIELRVGFDGVIDAFDRYAEGSFDGIRTIFKPDQEEPSK
ncbi:MAG TPA: alcohol dehydrogenase catalytic domain-containing protein [Solirubrobacterales bacterium]